MQVCLERINRPVLGGRSWAGCCWLVVGVFPLRPIPDGRTLFLLAADWLSPGGLLLSDCVALSVCLLRSDCLLLSDDCLLRSAAV